MKKKSATKSKQERNMCKKNRTTRVGGYFLSSHRFDVILTHIVRGKY